MLVPVPPTQAWKAPETGKPMTQTLLVLVRRTPPAAPQAAAPASAFRTAAFLPVGADEAQGSDSVPVQVIRTPSDVLLPANPDAVREKFAHMISSDPAGTVGRPSVLFCR